MDVIVCNKLVKSFGKKVVLKKITFQAPEGLTLILGRNGSGKTTLVKILSTLLPFDSGEIYVRGVNVREKRNIRRMISYLPQETLIDEVSTVREQLTLHSRLFGVSMKRSLEIAEILGLSDLDILAGEMSGGMKRRLCVALSLIPEREIYILDEPFEGIDFGGKLRIRECLSEILREGKSIILVSHTITGLEDLADHILILDNGMLKFSGAPSELEKKFSEIASLRTDNEKLIDEAIELGFAITQSNSLSVVGRMDELIALADKYGVKPSKAGLGEIYAFCVSGR